MANTYTKILLHVVFAVKNRNGLLPPLYQPEIHSYIGGILRRAGHVPIKIGGTANHIHAFLSYNIKQLIPEMVREIKSASSRFINEKHFIPYKFEWQAGYACVSHSAAQTETVKRYIENQYEHHKGTSLVEETKLMLERSGIEFDERYIFEEP